MFYNQLSQRGGPKKTTTKKSCSLLRQAQMTFIKQGQCHGQSQSSTRKIAANNACGHFLLHRLSSVSQTSVLRHFLGPQAEVHREMCLGFTFSLVSEYDSSVPVRKPVSRLTYWESRETQPQLTESADVFFTFFFTRCHNC